MWTNGKEFFIDNFEEYRCRPWFLPFVSWLRPDVDASENLKKCSSSRTSALLGMVAVPLVNVTKTLGTGMNTTSKSVDIMTKGVSALATTISDKIEYTNQEMNKFQAMALYLFVKSKAIFDKIGALVFNFYYAFVSVTDLVNLVLMLPEILLAAIAFFVLVTGIVMGLIMLIGVILTAMGVSFAVAFFTMALAPPQFALAGTYFAALTAATIFFAIVTAIYVIVKKLYTAADDVSYCCFAPNARVVMHDGARRSMKDVRVGDVLLGDIRVLGVLQAKSGARDWCMCGDTLVSAAHERWDEDDRCWFRVGDRYPRVEHVFLRRYCLVTDRHVIPTADGWFRDFQEVCAGSDAIARDARRVLSALNSNENNKARGGNDDPRRTGVVKEFERGERQSGFERGTQVITRDGPRSIEDIEIGTQMPNGAAVLDTYRCDLRNAI